jgi:hypothetical protein
MAKKEKPKTKPKDTFVDEFGNIVIAVIPVYTSPTDPKSRTATVYQYPDGRFEARSTSSLYPLEARGRTRAECEQAWNDACSLQDLNLAAMPDRTAIAVGVKY